MVKAPKAFVVTTLLFVLSALASQSAGAKTTASTAPFEVLTYKQMMMLSKESRAKYIREIRKFLILQERSSPNGAYEKLALLKDSPGLWDLLMPKAEAQSNSAQSADPTQSQAQSPQTLSPAISKLLKPSTKPKDAKQDPYADQGAAAKKMRDDAAAKAAGQNAPSTQTTQATQTTQTTDANAQVSARSTASSQTPTKTSTVCYFAGNLTFRDSTHICRYDYLVKDDPQVQKDMQSCGAGKIACNRALFGAKTNGDPFCVDISTRPIAKSATANCDSSGMSADDVANNFEKYKSKDWDNFAQNLRSFCGNPKTRTPECSYLIPRLDRIAQGPKGPDEVALCQTHITNANGDMQLFLVAPTSKPGSTDPADMGAPIFKKVDRNDPKIQNCNKTEQGNATLYDFGCVRGALSDADNFKVTDSKVSPKISVGIPSTGKTGTVEPKDGVCALSTDTAKADHNVDVCADGTTVCESRQPEPACSGQTQHPSYCFDVNGRGKDRYASGDMQDCAKALNNKDRFNARDAKTMNAQENGKPEAEQDMLRFGEEASRKLSRDADREAMNAAPVPAQITGSSWDPFNQKIGDESSRLSDKYKCSGWWKIKDTKPLMDGATSSTTYVCYRTTPKVKKKDEKGLKQQLTADQNDVDRVYIRVNQMKDSKSLTEVGTLNNEGRPIDTDIYADGTIDPTAHIDRVDKHRGFWPFKANRKVYEIQLNHCPLTAHSDGSPRQLIVKKADYPDGPRFTACKADNSHTSYEPFMKLQQSGDNFKGANQGVAFQLSADSGAATGSVPGCNVKREGAPGKGFQEVVYEPVNSSSAPASAPSGKGYRTGDD